MLTLVVTDQRSLVERPMISKRLSIQLLNLFIVPTVAVCTVNQWVR